MLFAADWNRSCSIRCGWRAIISAAGNRPLVRETLDDGGAMEIVFWVIVAIVVLAVVYACALSFRKRKEALGREPFMSDVAPDTKGHGIDLQARRKTYDDVT
jgi:hypothetical protein